MNSLNMYHKTLLHFHSVKLGRIKKAFLTVNSILIEGTKRRERENEKETENSVIFATSLAIIKFISTIFVGHYYTNKALKY